MRYMGLDIGQKRIGIAISDPSGKVASPICVLEANAVFANGREWTRLVEEWEPDVLIFGLPLGLDGSATAQTQAVREAAEGVAARAHLPHFFTDERLSSKEAKRALREMGYDEKHMRGKVDMLAASIFLQAWLDSNNETKAESE